MPACDQFVGITDLRVVVEATATAVAAHADAITARFYPDMLQAHPETSSCNRRVDRCCWPVQVFRPDLWAAQMPAEPLPA